MIPSRSRTTPQVTFDPTFDPTPDPASPPACQADGGRRRCLRTLGLMGAAGWASLTGGCGGGGDDDDHDTEAASPELQRSVRRAADEAVAGGLVGVALGAVARGTAIAAAGRRRIDTPASIQRDDPFSIGSNSKAMAAATIAAAVEAGALRWRDRIGELMPALRSRLRADYAAVTLADLLDHRAGVLAFTGSGDDEARLFAALAAAGGSLPQHRTGRRRWFTDWVLRQAPPAGVRPGRDFHYSNAGYAIAATLLEAATGRSFEAQAQALLAGRLGVHGVWRTPLDVPTTVPPPMPAGHEGPPGAVRPVTVDGDWARAGVWLDVLNPAGGWAGSPADYARWLRVHLQALRGAVTRLPHSYVQGLQRLPAEGYALGWAGVALNGRVVLTHTGHELGFMAETVLDAAGTQAVFACTNTGWMADDGSSWVLSTLDGVLGPVWQRGAGG